MNTPVQLNLLEEQDAENTYSELNNEKLKREELGTFKDSLRAPIHRWFTYPAGFSYKEGKKVMI